MPFNPTLPADNTAMNADEVRAQLNALKSLIDSLDARVTALENPPLTATGFGDPASNGVLTPIGTFNSQPLYQTAGGDFVFFTTDGAAPGWRITGQDPNVSELNVKYSTNAGNMFPTVITDPWYVFIAGTPPAGTVS